MTGARTPAERQRRLGGIVFLVVGLINVVLGVIVGAAVTIGVGVFLLIAGGVLLATSATARPPGG